MPRGGTAADRLAEAAELAELASEAHARTCARCEVWQEEEAEPHPACGLGNVLARIAALVTSAQHG